MLTEKQRDELRKEILQCLLNAHHEARLILETTVDAPNTIDSGHRAVTMLIKATTLQQMLNVL